MRLLSRRCEVCGARLGPFDRECRRCVSLGAEEVEVGGALRLTRWSPAPGEIAARFDLVRPRQVFGAGLIVERGQAAVITIGGNIAATLQPGPYRFDQAVLDDLAALGPAGHVCLTFVLTADLDMRLDFEEVLTRDHLPVSGSAVVVVRVGRPARFVAKLLTSRLRFTRRDLCRFLAGPMADAMTDFLSRSSAFDLDSRPETKRRMAAVLETHLNPVLEEGGLELAGLRSVRFHQEGVMEERRALGQVLLAERQLEILKRRVATWEKVTELKAQLAAVEARTAQQVADLRRSLESRAQDQELVRRQMREKMEMEHRLELARLRAQLPPEERPLLDSSLTTPRHLRRATQAYAHTLQSTAPPAGFPSAPPQAPRTGTETLA